MEDRSPIAVASIIENDGKVLLIKEARGSAKGKWNQPAGRLERGETIQQGALREAKEETGYDVELVGLVGIYDEMGNKEKPRVRFVFTARLSNNNQEEFSKEIAEVKWVTKEELKNLREEEFASSASFNSFQDYLSGNAYSLDTLH